MTHDTPAPEVALPTRRTLIKGAAVGAGALAVLTGPLRFFDETAAAAPAVSGDVFGYGVASGDPTATTLIIWTRVAPSIDATPGSGQGAATPVSWQVATDAAFKKIVKQGTCTTSPDSDHTVKVDVTGLAPYTRYFYRFSAAGQTSVVGRAQTAPDVAGKVHALRFALVSCSNFTGGYFTAYRQIAKRTDLDFVLHVGDYIYEYANAPSDGPDGRYGPAELIGKRDVLPENTLLSLKDYRLRHALHKADPDAQAAHQAMPWITIFDDHEVANNSWEGGAENQPAGTTREEFLARRNAAYQAYLEWMPFRLPEQAADADGTTFYKKFTFGALGDLSILETRQHRAKPTDSDVAAAPTNAGGFIPAGLKGLTDRSDAEMADPSRHLPDPTQMQWLKGNIASPGHWHLLGNQVIITPVRFPASAMAPQLLQKNGGPLPDDAMLVNSDQWDGYQADQADLIASMAKQPAANGDVVVLTGDIHSSWVTEIPTSGYVAGKTDYESAGVEFVTPSVTSDGFYEQVLPAVLKKIPTANPELGVSVTKSIINDAQKINPWVRYLDGIAHGFTVIDVTPKRVQADFFHTPNPTTALPDPRTDPTVVPVYTTSWQTLNGSKKVTPVPAAVGARSDSPAGTPMPPAKPNVALQAAQAKLGRDVQALNDARKALHHAKGMKKRARLKKKIKALKKKVAADRQAVAAAR